MYTYVRAEYSAYIGVHIYIYIGIIVTGVRSLSLSLVPRESQFLL